MAGIRLHENWQYESMAKSTKKKGNQKAGVDSVLRKNRRGSSMVFSRHNYVLLLMAVAFVFLGYVIMRIDNQVEGFISLYVAPLMILGGYLGVIYAILWREKPASS